MRLLLFLLTASTASSLQTDQLKLPFNLESIQEKVADLPLCGCLAGLLAEIEGFAPTDEEQLAMDEERGSIHGYDGFVNVNSTDQLLALIQERAPHTSSFFISRIHVYEKVLAKLDPEADQFVRSLPSVALKTFLGVLRSDPDSFRPVRETVYAYNRLSPVAKDSIDRTFCVSELAPYFEETRKAAQCMLD